MKILLPTPHKGQRYVLNHARRFNMLRCGRNWFKTTLCGAIAVESIVTSKTREVMWVSPTYAQSEAAMDEARKMMGGAARFNSSAMFARLPNGNQILFRSFDKPDNLRSRHPGGVVVDEAAFDSGYAWRDVLRPMLVNDPNAWAWLIGTPKGRNWYWQTWNDAQDKPDWALFHAPTLGVKIEGRELVRVPHPLENPLIQFEEIKNAFGAMSERSFRQEILAEFVEDGAGVFRNIRALSTLPRLPLRDGAEYLIGVDWGRRSDASVFSVWDIGTKQEVAMHRLPVVTFGAQISELKRIADEYRDALVIAESNGMGDPLIEQAAQAGIRIMQFVTTAATKAHGVDALALACENGSVQFQADETGILEMESFESIGATINGLPRYSAPEGAHDDIVMARVIAYSGLAQARPVLLWE